MTDDLTRRRCRPLEGQPPMRDAEIRSNLEQLTGWALVDGAIEKRYGFADYHRTMAFVNAVAWIAHAEDHHPDLAVGYNKCTVRYSTHSVGGISINDFICAAKVDALLR
jgi:4a-hydroxytetrahydrobiopterin dehydratase